MLCSSVSPGLATAGGWIDSPSIGARGGCTPIRLAWGTICPIGTATAHICRPVKHTFWTWHLLNMGNVPGGSMWQYIQIYISSCCVPRKDKLTPSAACTKVTFGLYYCSTCTLQATCLAKVNILQNDMFLSYRKRNMYSDFIAHREIYDSALGTPLVPSWIMFPSTIRIKQTSSWNRKAIFAVWVNTGVWKPIHVTSAVPL